MRTRVIAFCSLLMILPAIGSAHHGKDFLLTATSSTPHTGQWFGLLASDFEHSTSALTIEPGLLYGITGWWSGEFHAHLDRVSGLTNFESVGLEQRFLLHRAAAPGASGLPVDLGLLVEFEKGVSVDAPDRLELRTLLSHSGEEWEVAANLIGLASLTHERETTLSIALGAKHSIGSLFAVGVELRDNLRSMKQLELTPVMSVSLGHSSIVQIGSSFATEAGSDQSVIIRASLLVGL